MEPGAVGHPEISHDPADVVESGRVEVEQVDLRKVVGCGLDNIGDLPSGTAGEAGDPSRTRCAGGEDLCGQEAASIAGGLDRCKAKESTIDHDACPPDTGGLVAVHHLDRVPVSRIATRLLPDPPPILGGHHDLDELRTDPVENLVRTLRAIENVRQLVTKRRKDLVDLLIRRLISLVLDPTEQLTECHQCRSERLRYLGRPPGQAGPNGPTEAAGRRRHPLRQGPGNGPPHVRAERDVVDQCSGQFGGIDTQGHRPLDGHHLGGRRALQDERQLAE